MRMWRYHNSDKHKVNNAVKFNRGKRRIEYLRD